MRSRPRRPPGPRAGARALLALLGGVLLLGACTAAPRAGAPEDRATADGTAVAGDGDREGGELVVYAAASLTDVAGPLADGFAASHPGVRVRFDVDGSNALAHRLAEGAPADVVALADDATMATVGQAGRLDGPTRTFARNRPAVVVPAEGGADLSSIADLARPGVRVGLCAPTVPCGKIGRRALDQAGVAVAPVTEETDVRALLARVVAGELDAGIVYRTDAIAAGHRVRTIPFPDTVDVVTTYPIAAVTGSADPALAHAFVDHVLGPDGRAVLRAAGFEAP